MADAITATLYLVLILIGFPIATIGLLLYYDLRGLGKSIIMYWETEKVAKMMRKEAKDGVIQIGKKRILVDKSVHEGMIKHGIFVRALRPLYMIKWNKPIPMKVTEKGLELSHDAENLKNLIENKTLAQLLTPAGKGKEALLFLLIGAVMGGLAGYIVATSL
jgi:hypothetical protein